MGTWGAALFSDDTAADVRGEFRDHLGDGLSGPEATRKLVRDWGNLTEDPDEAPSFWLALAVTQWKLGRLESWVKDRALAIIEDGSDLQRFVHSPALLKQRTRVLTQVREQLQSPEPPARRIPRRFVQATALSEGDGIAYSLPDGRCVALVVTGYHSDRGGTMPQLDLLDWCHQEAPRRELLDKLPVPRMWPAHPSNTTVARFIIAARPRTPVPAERIRVIATGVRRGPSRSGGVVTWWGQPLDEILLRIFGSARGTPSEDRPWP